MKTRHLRLGDPLTTVSDASPNLREHGRIADWAATALALGGNSTFVAAFLPAELDRHFRWGNLKGSRVLQNYKLHVNATGPGRARLGRAIDLSNVKDGPLGRRLTIHMDALGPALEAVSLTVTARDKDGNRQFKAHFPVGVAASFMVSSDAVELEIDIDVASPCGVDIFGLFVGHGAVDETRRKLAKREMEADRGYVEQARARAASVPDSNGSRVYSRLDRRVGVICDEWLFNCWSDAIDLVYLGPTDWRRRLNGLDLVVITTVWHGLNKSEWSGTTSPGSANQRRLADLVAACREASIPVAFFSAEDPPHFDDFIETAKMTDFVFTCCVEKIPDYIQRCGHSRVYQLPFAFNPGYHHPVGTTMDDRERGALFAGSWMLRYPERQRDTEMLFDGILESGTDFRIIDRNFNLESDRYIFPEKYFPYIVPALEHDVLQRLHKTYPFAVNLNAVKYSATMFANRVVELQAMGIALLSNYSVGVAQEFPNVKIYVDAKDVVEDLRSMSRRDLLELRMDGIRRVYRKYCVYDVLRDLLAKCGIPTTRADEPVVLVVGDTHSEKFRASVERQSFETVECATVEELAKIDTARYEAVAFFSDDYEYGTHYLEDLFNGFKYTKSSYILKDGYLDGDAIVSGSAHQFVDVVSEKARAMFWGRDFTAAQLLEIQTGQRLESGYAIDPLNVTRRRPELSPDRIERDLTVIVPVYNNGEFLKFRAFASLKRSSVFHRMKVVLVDDGSSDIQTLEIVRELASRHRNVEAYFFPLGGSGSASRPRNKGVSVAATPFVTFLDPDNEAIGDGYASLLARLEEVPEANFAMGEMTILRDRIYTTNLSKRLRNEGTVVKGDVLELADRLIPDSDFGVQSMQAMVFRTEFLSQEELALVEGAYAEDSLFHYELLHTQGRAVISDSAIHTYYSAIADSGTNTIGAAFFQRTCLGIEATFDFFERVGLLREYVQDRFTPYVFGWLMDGRFNTIQDPVVLASCAPPMLKMLKRAVSTGLVTDPRILELADVLEHARWDELPGRKYLIAPEELCALMAPAPGIGAEINGRVLEVEVDGKSMGEFRIPIARLKPADVMAFDLDGTGALLDASGTLDISLEVQSKNPTGAVDWKARFSRGDLGKLDVPINSRSIEISLIVIGQGRATVRGVLFAPHVLLKRSESFPGSAIALDRLYGVTLAERAERGFADRILDGSAAPANEPSSRIYERQSIDVAIVCDPLLFEAFQPSVRLHYVSSDDPYLPVGAQALLIAATWGGIDGGWNHFKPETDASEKIQNLILQARRAGVPVGYIGKDDPSDFSHFTHVAQECDYIFTMASESIPGYLDLVDHDRVYLTAFPFDPMQCNPIGSLGTHRRRGFVFGGAWYGDKFPERRDSLEMVFDGLIASGEPFHIVLRTFDSLWPMFRLPEKYMRYASTAVDHETLVALHRQFIGSVNANSVVDSETMFATRVVELQAMGNMVVSTPSKAISRLFPAVQIPESVLDVSAAATDLDSSVSLAVRMSGVRDVYRSYSSFDVVTRLLHRMGLSVSTPVEPRVCVVAQGDLRELTRQLDAQTYPHRRLISLDQYQSGASIAEEIVAFWGDAYAYGVHYLEDMVNAFKYTGATYVCRDAYLRDGKITDGVVHGFVSEVPDRERTLFWRADFQDQVPIFSAGHELAGGYAVDPLELSSTNRISSSDGSDC